MKFFISVPYETGDSLAEVVNRFEDMGANRTCHD